MTKTSKAICFFLAVISLAAGVIYAGERYAAKSEIDWLVVVLVVGFAAFLLIVTTVVPDIDGPGQGLGLAGGDSDGSSSGGDSSSDGEG